MVAKQMELVLEGCLSRMLVNRSRADVDTAHRLAEDILRFARCRRWCIDLTETQKEAICRNLKQLNRFY